MKGGGSPRAAGSPEKFDQNGKVLTEEMRVLQMKRLHRLCKDPAKRNEGTVTKLVEVTCALCHFFRTMPTQLQFELCRVIQLERFSKNDIVFKQGDHGDKFYVIVQGRVEVRICMDSSATSDPRQAGHNTVAWLHRGDSFGELALIKNAPRTASIVVPSSKTEVLSIHKEDFERILVGLYGASLNERALFLRRLWTFAALPTRLVQQLATFTSVAIFQVRPFHSPSPSPPPPTPSTCPDNLRPSLLLSLSLSAQTGALFDTEKDNRLYFIVEGECRLCLLDEEEQQEHGEQTGVVVEAQIDKNASVGVGFGEEQQQKKKPDSDVGFYNAKTISRLGPGNFFGEGCIFPEIRRYAAGDPSTVFSRSTR